MGLSSQPAPANEEEMMVAIFEYIDRLFAMVRPRKVLFMAIGTMTLSTSCK
jgi:5'-3' exoribonuclease 2